MQTRICDCHLNKGGCFCNLNNTENERKRINSNEKSNKEHNGSSVGNTKPNEQPKRPLDWDARDLKTYAWLPKSGRSIEGRYTNGFWEEE